MKVARPKPSPTPRPASSPASPARARQPSPTSTATPTPRPAARSSAAFSSRSQGACLPRGGRPDAQRRRGSIASACTKASTSTPAAPARPSSEGCRCWPPRRASSSGPTWTTRTSRRRRWTASWPLGAGGLHAPEVLDRLRGRQVWIDHGDGVVTRYCHLLSIEPGIAEDVAVEVGQVVAHVGNSGTPEGVIDPNMENHLHFEIRVGDSYPGPGPLARRNAAPVGGGVLALER